MKFVILGTLQFAINCTEALIKCGADIRGIISLVSDVAPLCSVNIADFAKSKGIPYFEVPDINAPESVALVKSLEPDYIFSLWPKILKREILDVPKYFTIGVHTTKLPFNRGRHPLHWMIVLGIPETTLSLFKMDEGVDTGDVLLQVPYQISDSDYIEDVVEKMNRATYEGAMELCSILSKNASPEGWKQNHTIANYWRKRTPYDVTLDLRMPAMELLRIVRSFAPPYPCANLIFGDKIIKIVSASIIADNMSPDALRRMEHGKIVSVDDLTIKVKTGDCIIELKSLHELPDEIQGAKYIYPPLKYMADYPETLIPLLKG